jgi:hypothetical protein
MRRWAPDELEREKAALEAYIGLAEDQVTLDVQMRVVEYTVQRYLPADDKRSEADWRRWRAATRAGLVAAIHGQPLPPRPPVKRVPIPPDPEFEAWILELKKRR